MLYIIIPTYKETAEIRTKMLLETKKEFPSSYVRQVIDSSGEGKGATIRRGVEDIYKKMSENDKIAYIDGDLDIHPRELHKLLAIDSDVVVGTKQIKGLFVRRIVTLLSRFYIKVLFDIGVETQTGIKVFTKKSWQWYKSDNFAFDIELLARIKKAGYSISQVPIEAHITKNVSIKALIKTFLETIRILFAMLF